MHALLHLDMAFHDSATAKPEETVCAMERDCAAVEAAITHRVSRVLRCPPPSAQLVAIIYTLYRIIVLPIGAPCAHICLRVYPRINGDSIFVMEHNCAAEEAGITHRISWKTRFRQ